MPEFRFDPPLTLKGNIVVHNLDDAVRFMIGYREARRPELQTSVLTALREPPENQRSAMPRTHFAAGQRQKASSSKSANKEASASNHRPQLGNSYHRQSPQRWSEAILQTVTCCREGVIAKPWQL